MVKAYSFSDCPRIGRDPPCRIRWYCSHLQLFLPGLPYCPHRH